MPTIERNKPVVKRDPVVEAKGREGAPQPAVTQEAVQRLLTEPLQLLELKADGAGNVSVRWRHDVVSRSNAVYPETFSGVTSAEDLAQRLDAKFNEVFPEFKAQEANNQVWREVVEGGMGYAASASGSVLTVSKAGQPVRDIDVGYPIDSMVSLVTLTDQLRLRRGVGDLGDKTRLPACALVAGVAPGPDGVKQCRVTLLNLETGKPVSERSFAAANYPNTLQVQKVIPAPPPVAKPPEPERPAEPTPPQASSYAERQRYQSELNAYDQALRQYNDAMKAYRASPEYKAWKKDHDARMDPVGGPRARPDPASAPEVLTIAPGKVEIRLTDPACNLDGHLRPFRSADEASFTLAFDYTVTPDAADLAQKTAEAKARLGEHLQFEVVGRGGGKTILGTRAPSGEMLRNHSGSLLDYRLPLVPIEFPRPDFA